MKNSEKRIFFKIYSALIFKQGSSKIYPLIIYPEKIDSKNIFSKKGDAIVKIDLNER